MAGAGGAAVGGHRGCWEFAACPEGTRANSGVVSYRRRRGEEVRPGACLRPDLLREVQAEAVVYGCLVAMSELLPIVV